MKALKQIVIDDLLARINESPYLIVVDYSGMKVAEFEGLRRRLSEQEGKLQVTKNTFVRLAAAAAEYPDGLVDLLGGQTAVAIGTGDVCAVAKILKTYSKEIKKLEIRGGVLDGVLLNKAQVEAIADLPPMDSLRAQLLGLFQTPAQQFVRLLNEPGASLARVLQAKADQG